MAPGRKLEDPVDETWRPDLKGTSHEVNEYLEEQGGYDLFDGLIRELMIHRPADPLQHMVNVLEKGYPTGSMKVIVSSPPGLGRSKLARRLAEHFDLVYISAGELLHEAGVDTSKLGFAEDEYVADYTGADFGVMPLVMELIEQSQRKFKGFVLDGFPRTARQTTFLKEKGIVPSHVLVLKASEDFVREHQRQIGEGIIQGETYYKPEVLEQKLRAHTCHNALALDVYKDSLTVIDAAQSPDDIFSKMEQAVRTRPRSKGPKPPPRVVILGPEGAGAPDHAGRLAERLGAVFVDARELAGPGLSVTLRRAAENDPLGVVGARLRQVDCTRQGWVLCGFPSTIKQASGLSEDSMLAPLRVVRLAASADCCAQRAACCKTDPLTRKVWFDEPQNENIRLRLERSPQHEPHAVQSAHGDFEAKVGGLVKALNGEAGVNRCFEVSAEGPREQAFDAIVEFVERQLPMPPRTL